VNGTNPSVLVALANLQRRRRWDTAPRAPFADAGQARRALAEDGVAIPALTQRDLPALTRLADAVSELADGLALRQPPASRAVGIVNELASGCLRQCQRKECDLLFFDTTRSRSQRWHAESPCGWLERQHRREGWRRPAISG
jgi:predicted RNA-binding Zn ribbon-like protein